MYECDGHVDDGDSMNCIIHRFKCTSVRTSDDRDNDGDDDDDGDDV